MFRDISLDVAIVPEMSFTCPITPLIDPIAATALLASA